MDPLSISAACLTLLDAVAKTSTGITAFVKSCHDARADLADVPRELASLRYIVDLLKVDSEIKDGDRLVPQHLQEQILAILDKCSEILAKIDTVIDQHEGRAGVIRWAITGKSDIAHLRQSLEAYRNALSLALETVTLALAKDTLVNTQVLRNEAADIKSLAARILAEIERLRDRDTLEVSTEPRHNSSHFLLQRWLEDVTSYAATISEEIQYQDEADVFVAEQHPSGFKTPAESSSSALVDQIRGPPVVVLPLAQLDLHSLRQEPVGADWLHETLQLMGLQQDGCGLEPTDRQVVPEADHQVPVANSTSSTVDTDFDKTDGFLLDDRRRSGELGNSPSWTSLLLGYDTTPTDDIDNPDPVSKAVVVSSDACDHEGLRQEGTRTSSLAAPESKDLGRGASGIDPPHSVHSIREESSLSITFVWKVISNEPHKDGSVKQITMSRSADFLATLHADNVIKIWMNRPCNGTVQTPHVMNLSIQKKFSLSNRPSEVDHVAFSSTDTFIYVYVQRGSTSTIELWDWRQSRRIDHVPTYLFAQSPSMAGAYVVLANRPTKIEAYEGTAAGLQRINRHKLDIPRAKSMDLQAMGVCQNPDISDMALATREKNDVAALHIVRTQNGNVETQRGVFKELRTAYPLGVASDNGTTWSIWEDWGGAHSSWYILTWDMVMAKLALIDLPQFSGYTLRLSPNGECLAAWRKDYEGSLSILDGKTGRELTVLHKVPVMGEPSLDRITMAQFSTDNRHLVVAYAGGFMRSYEIRKSTENVLAADTKMAG